MAIFSAFFRTKANDTSPSKQPKDNKNSKYDKTDSRANHPHSHQLNNPRLTSSTPTNAMNSASQSKPPTSTNIQTDCEDCGDFETYRPITPTDFDDNLQPHCKDRSTFYPHGATTPDEPSTAYPHMMNRIYAESGKPCSSQATNSTLTTSPTTASLKRRMPSTPFDVDASPKRTISEFSTPPDGAGKLNTPRTVYSDEDTSPRGRLIRRTVSGVEMPRVKMRDGGRFEEDDEIQFVDAQQEDEEEDEFVDADDGAGMGEGYQDGVTGEEDWEYEGEEGDDEMEDMAAGRRFVTDVVNEGGDEEEEEEEDDDDDVQDLFASSFGKRAIITISDDSDSDSSDSDSKEDTPATTRSAGPSAIPSKTLLPIDPHRHLSPHTTAHHKLHLRVLSHLPRLPLAPHRYWIAVLPPHLLLRSLTSEKQITWLRGNRLTTVETVWRMYALTTVSEGFVLVLGGGEKGWRGEEPGWGTRMEEVDYFGDRRVVFRAVLEGEEGDAGVGVGGAVFRGLVREGGRTVGKEADWIVLDD